MERAAKTRVPFTVLAASLERAKALLDPASDEAVMERVIEEGIRKLTDRRLEQEMNEAPDEWVEPERHQPRLVHVEAGEACLLEGWLSDGRSARVDIRHRIWGRIFEPVREPAFFRQVVLRYSAPTWPNGADICGDLVMDWIVTADHVRPPSTDPAIIDLLQAMRKVRPALKALLDQVSMPWAYDQHLRALYEERLDVDAVSAVTTRILEALRRLAPDRDLQEPWRNDAVLNVSAVATGTADPSGDGSSARARRHSAFAAYQHARHMLTLVHHFSGAFYLPPSVAPAGWASILRLYGLPS